MMADNIKHVRRGVAVQIIGTQAFDPQAVQAILQLRLKPNETFPVRFVKQEISRNA